MPASPPKSRTLGFSSMPSRKPDAIGSSRTKPPAPRLARPGLDNALSHLREGDVLVIWKLDRLGRTIRGLIELVGELRERGVGVWSLDEGFGTSAAGDRLISHVFAALAKRERDLTRERTKAGLAAARARGRNGGRKP